MSALDDLFDGHYFTEDPHVYIPIDEAMDELSALRSEIERLKAENEELKKKINKPYDPPYDPESTKTYTCEADPQYTPIVRFNEKK